MARESAARTASGLAWTFFGLAALAFWASRTERELGLLLGLSFFALGLLSRFLARREPTVVGGAVAARLPLWEVILLAVLFTVAVLAVLALAFWILMWVAFRRGM